MGESASSGLDLTKINKALDKDLDKDSVDAKFVLCSKKSLFPLGFELVGLAFRELSDTDPWLPKLLICICV